LITRILRKENGSHRRLTASNETLLYMVKYSRKFQHMDNESTGVHKTIGLEFAGPKVLDKPHTE